MSNLSLTDVLKLLDEDPMSFISHSDEMNEFANEIDSIAADILRTKDSAYILGMMNLIQSLAASIMINQGANPMVVIEMLADRDNDMYMALVMKLTLGLSVMEELR